MSAARPRQNGRLTDACFPPPRQIPKTKLQEILEAHGFENGEIKRMTSFLESLVEIYHSDIKAARHRKTRRADRSNLKVAAKKIAEAIWRLNACGLHGREMAESSLSSLGEMFAVSWLREAFPDDDGLPAISYPVSRSPRAPVRRLWGELEYIEEHTREARHHFAREHNLSLISAALNEIEKSLRASVNKGRGGRNPCLFRHVFLINLALGWRGIGRDPHRTGPFEFPVFCDHIFEKIGWPRGGIKRAIDKALTDPRAAGSPPHRYFG